MPTHDLRESKVITSTYLIAKNNKIKLTVSNQECLQEWVAQTVSYSHKKKMVKAWTTMIKGYSRPPSYNLVVKDLTKADRQRATITLLVCHLI